MHDWLGDLVSLLVNGVPKAPRVSPEEAAGYRKLLWIVGVPVSVVVITIILVKSFK